MTTGSLQSPASPPIHSDVCLDVPAENAPPTLPSLDPDNRSLIDKVPLISPHRATAIIERATDAQRAWQRRPLEARIERVHKLFDHILSHRTEILDQVSRETGKNGLEARRELMHTLDDITHQLRHAPAHLGPAQHTPLRPRPSSRTSRTPRGVVLIIANGFAPLYSTLAPAAAALMSGNAAIVVGNHHAPLTTQYLGQLAHQAGVADDLWQTVCGERRLVDALADRADAIASYSSAMNTRRIARRQGERMIPIVGRWPTDDLLLVLADADLEQAAHAAVDAACGGAGRRLRSLRRIYIQNAIHDAFVDHVVEAIGTLRASAADDAPLPGVGPLFEQSEVNAIQDLVDDATDSGARLVAGGHPHGRSRGYYYTPTVLTQVDESMRIWRESAPGPVVAISSIQAPADALERCRLADQASALSIFTNQPEIAHQLADFASTPAVSINHILHFLPPQTPPLATGSQGCPDPLGAHRLSAFTRQSVVLQKSPAQLSDWLPPGSHHHLQRALDTAMTLLEKKRHLRRHLKSLWPLSSSP